MSKKWGLIVAKKEMTKLWIDDAFAPVTLLKVVSQEVIRYKTQDKDGYVAMVVWVDKKDVQKAKGNKVHYSMVAEFPVDEQFMQDHQQGSILSSDVLEGITTVSLIGESKGKGFQGVMKRFHTKGWPKTHGSKFHRQVWSLGNRKPRRVQKGHPHAGRMGGDQITLKKVSILDTFKQDNEILIAVKGSVPGAYNRTLKLVIG